jgi:hypothetical protein
MAKSTKRSPAGLMSEAAKKAGRAIGDAAKMAVGKEPSSKRKSPTGNLKEAAKKAGRAVADVARKAVGKPPTKIKKSGSR